MANLNEIEKGVLADTKEDLHGDSRRPEARYDVLAVAVDNDVYKMHHSSRGKCIIFNNKTFDSHVKLPERNGTDGDAVSLYCTFQKLGFEVVVYKDYSKREILDELENVSKDNHVSYDAFVCIILTHGDTDVVFGRDGKFRSIEMLTPFLDDKCSSLSGKPKLFFFQACQGDRRDSGIKLRRMESADCVCPTTCKMSTFVDFLIAYSTIPGFLSWRNETKGSCFIQTLCKVLDQYGKEKELLEMLTIVNRKVCYEFESYVPNISKLDKKKQVPCFTSMLTRKVYFTPKN